MSERVLPEANVLDGVAAEAAGLAAYEDYEIACRSAPADDDRQVAAECNRLKDGVLRDQCSLLRYVLNPFRHDHLDPSCGTPTATDRARADDERLLPAGLLDAVRLAVLADALEEIGGTADVVAHLREPGPHVRGCWVVDLVLGLS